MSQPSFFDQGIEKKRCVVCWTTHHLAIDQDEIGGRVFCEHCLYQVNSDEEVLEVLIKLSNENPKFRRTMQFLADDEDLPEFLQRLMETVDTKGDVPLSVASQIEGIREVVDEDKELDNGVDVYTEFQYCVLLQSKGIDAGPTGKGPLKRIKPPDLFKDYDHEEQGFMRENSNN